MNDNAMLKFAMGDAAVGLKVQEEVKRLKADAAQKDNTNIQLMEGMQSFFYFSFFSIFSLLIYIYFEFFNFFSLFLQRCENKKITMHI